MTEHGQIENVSAARPLKCEEWEALLADAIDGTLNAEDSAAFDAHTESCKACATTLVETRKGQQWLQFLHEEPEAPGDLLARILARTTGTATGASLAGASLTGASLTGASLTGASLTGASLTGAIIAGNVMAAPIQIVPLPPLWKRASVRGFIPALIRRAGEPRIMMTAAMAFFSIALTMNLVGVRVSSIRLADLKPSVLQTNIRRSYITANARVSRYYDNLRIVYEVEARMREMQRTSEEEQAAPIKQRDKKPDGSAGKAPAPGGKSQRPRDNGSRAYLSGHSELARLEFIEPGMKFVENHRPEQLDSEKLDLERLELEEGARA
jgi:hypothetical protein